MLFWRASPPAIMPGKFITITNPTCLSQLPWQLRGQHWSHFQSSLFSPANPTSPAQPGQPNDTAKNPTSILQSHTWKPGCHRDTATPQASVHFPVKYFTSTTSAISHNFQLLLDLADSSVPEWMERCSSLHHPKNLSPSESPVSRHAQVMVNST